MASYYSQIPELAALADCPPPGYQCLCDPCAVAELDDVLDKIGVVGLRTTIGFIGRKVAVVYLAYEAGAITYAQMMYGFAAVRGQYDVLACLCDKGLFSVILGVIVDYGIQEFRRLRAYWCKTCQTPVKPPPSPVTPPVGPGPAPPARPPPGVNPAACGPTPTPADFPGE